MADSSGKLKLRPSKPLVVGCFVEIGPSQKQELSDLGAENKKLKRRLRALPWIGVAAIATQLLLAWIGVTLALGTVARSGPALSYAAAKGHQRVLGTATPVTTLAADGSIAAVSTECGRRFLEEVAWNPVLRGRRVHCCPQRARTPGVCVISPANRPFQGSAERP